MKYVLYTRVSERGSGWSGETSVAAQAEECRAYILRTDPAATFEIVNDEFVSGTHNSRPGLRRILDGIATADWSCLVCIDIDRLCRSQDGWRDLVRILTAHKKGLVCIRQAMDFRDVQGHFMLSMFVLISEYFAKQGAQKTRDKMRWAAAQGYWMPGEVPFGYVRPDRIPGQPRRNEDNILKPDPESAPLVRQIFTDYISGESVTKLARRMDLPEDRVNRILRNPVYSGRVRYDDIDAQGKHEALITADQFAAAQSRLPGKTNTPRPSRHTYGYLLAGKVICECGHVMSASHAKGGSGKRYPQYRCGNARCTAARKLVRADQLDRSVLEAIAVRSERSAEIRTNFKRLVDMAKTLRRQSSPALERLNRDIEPLQRRADNLSRALQDGTIGPAAMKHLGADLDTLYSQLDPLRAERGRLESELDALTPPETIEALATAWLATARSLIDSDDIEQQRRWMHHHIKRIVHQTGADWRVEFWADPSTAGKVRVTSSRGTNHRWLCELLVTIAKRAA